ncbi:hypothetical protein [Paramicrobacterium agarici]|uniref:Excreted virulence factor EspC (Type VII ESX diderm) n=1 Tax=Paramicrobacterium agarici TaxID=630514 RepID=A0A2A9DW35_9MICO|nr:hypothetical protein [Microbacterium agarici]PFG30345.1 hypothetical protein ATJ78_1274 [Microbacterium agarici]
MPGKIWLNMQDLRDVQSGLKTAVDEFAAVADRNEDVAASVGVPFDNHDLKNKVEDFEKDWNDNRAELSDGLGKLREHLHDIITAYDDYDANLASQLETSEHEALSQGGRDNTPV